MTVHTLCVGTGQVRVGVMTKRNHILVIGKGGMEVKLRRAAEKEHYQQ
jgi:hypothetical protein